MSDGPYRDRYAAMAAMSDEDRAAARALSTASFEKTFPPLLVEFAGGALQYSPHGPLTDPIEQITRSPHECPAWVRRREKARREIAEHKAHIDTIERLARMLEVDEETESTVVVEANGRDDFAAERSQFERLLKRFTALTKQETR